METHRTVVITTKKQQRWISRFHPTKPILACGSCQVVLFKTTNASSPFLHWREKQMKFGPSLNKRITALEWNVRKINYFDGIFSSTSSDLLFFLKS
jgi:hypothetical protein